MSSLSKRLTFEQTATLAARHVRAGERVYLADDVPPQLRERLHPEARVVSGKGEEPVDVAVVRARCVTTKGHVCTPAGRVNGHDPFAHVPAAERVLVLLLADASDDEPPCICAHDTTGTLVASRIVTSVAVIDVREEGLQLRTLAPGVSAREAQGSMGVPLLADHTLDELDI